MSGLTWIQTVRRSDVFLIFLWKRSAYDKKHAIIPSMQRFGNVVFYALRCYASKIFLKFLLISSTINDASRLDENICW